MREHVSVRMLMRVLVCVSARERERERKRKSEMFGGIPKEVNFIVKLVL